MPATRDVCTQAGEYVSDCLCRALVKMQVGSFFPGCIGCGRTVEWRLVEDVQKPQ
jgi:hypothetical protein